MSKLTITISDEVLAKINQYKKDANKSDLDEAVNELISYALKLPKYYRDFNWEKAEQVADSEIAYGQTESFDTVEDFLSDLDK